MKKGCTFAPVFDLKTELFETDEKKEIACVVLRIKICRRHEDESRPFRKSRGEQACLLSRDEETR